MRGLVHALSVVVAVVAIAFGSIAGSAGTAVAQDGESTTTVAGETTTSELAPVTSVPGESGESPPETESERAARWLDTIVIALLALAALIAIITAIIWWRSRPPKVTIDSPAGRE